MTEQLIMVRGCAELGTQPTEFELKDEGNSQLKIPMAHTSTC